MVVHAYHLGQIKSMQIIPPMATVMPTLRISNAIVLPPVRIRIDKFLLPLDLGVQ